MKIYKIKGMYCSSCAIKLEWDLEDKGINIQCNFKTGEVKIEGEFDSKKFFDIVSQSGYTVIDE